MSGFYFIFIKESETENICEVYNNEKHLFNICEVYNNETHQLEGTEGVFINFRIILHALYVCIMSYSYGI